MEQIALDRAWRTGRVAGLVVLAIGTVGSLAIAVAASTVMAGLALLLVPPAAVAVMVAVERTAASLGVRARHAERVRPSLELATAD